MATKKYKETVASVVAVAVGAYLLGKATKKKDSENGIGATKYEFVDGKVIGVRYRNTSSYGNPSYWVTIETPDGDIIRGYTSPNASIAYGINNSEYKREYHTFAITWGVNGAIFHYHE